MLVLSTNKVSNSSSVSSGFSTVVTFAKFKPPINLLVQNRVFQEQYFHHYMKLYLNQMF